MELAADAAAALARLRTSHARFDVAAIDLDMPGNIDGRPSVVLCRELAMAGIPAVLMVPFREYANAERWRRLGFAATLTKPVKQRELAACLTALLVRGASADPVAGEPVPSSASEAALLGTRRLLSVEDNATNQELAVGILELLGYREVAVAGDGRQAMEALGRADFDLVLMDCQLPEIDGYEATRRIRQGLSGVRNRRVPVIAMTANALAGDREDCLAAGMNDYIAKPVRARALGQILEKWLAAREVPRVGGERGQAAEKAGEAEDWVRTS